MMKNELDNSRMTREIYDIPDYGVEREKLNCAGGAGYESIHET